MGIIIKNALVVVPQGEEDVIKETSLYIEGDRITGIGQAPAGFQEEKVIDGTDRLVIPIPTCLSCGMWRMIYPLWTGFSEQSTQSNSK